MPFSPAAARTPANEPSGARCLLALLKNEPGAAKVAEVIADASMSSVNYAEVVNHFFHVGMPVDQVEAMLRPLPITVIDADRALATIAGGLRAVTASAGLSLGDRFCLALARREGVPVLTADRQWPLVAEAAEVTVSVIR